ncbi:helix-turn-helix domain-containing protein [Gramella jeungdoensis]|uniref:Helix-turn-helix domain-containing protein n=1 Tax=Gramella jeungdoensis TaxID=708091 RepID=A0ABT0Z339_9FLAO|nr:helix-turn-helix domain-containing protein [Gramella jeungdoensis]MCM8569547.1 helix-turn-helix domain-containing protein [Gramella jeungdoensis]
MMENIHKKLEQIESKIEEHILNTKEFLDLNEASKYMRLSKSALYKLTSKGEIKFYQPGGKKIFFFKADLHEWIKKGKVQSTCELEDEVENYLNDNNKISRS